MGGVSSCQGAPSQRNRSQPSSPWEKDQAWFPEWKQYEQEANLHDSFAGEPEVPMLSCSSCVRCKKTRRKQIKRDITKRTYVYTNASVGKGRQWFFSSKDGVKTESGTGESDPWSNAISQGPCVWRSSECESNGRRCQEEPNLQNKEGLF